MKKLVRGGFILSLVGSLVVFVFAQTQTEEVPVIANDSQLQFNTKVNNSNSDKTLKAEVSAQVVQDQKDKKGSKVEDKQEEKTGEQTEKKLVEKTVSSRAVGANRGSFVATAYCLKGRTASGSMVRKGIIAADPRVLKLGTTVNLGAGGHSGQYVVKDTGGKIKGKRIDIWMASCAEARRFGRRNVTVHVP